MAVSLNALEVVHLLAHPDWANRTIYSRKPAKMVSAIFLHL